MKPFAKFSAFVLFVLAGNLGSAFASDVVGQEVLVKFRGTRSATNGNATLANRAIGATSVKTLSRLDVCQVRIPEGMSIEDALAYYRRLSVVEYVESNPKRHLDYIPNDPQFPGQYGPAKVRCHEAWNLTQGSSSVIVAVIDDGIAFDHEDLNSKRVAGHDFLDNDDAPFTSSNHGTHVSGIVAAATDNGVGVAGVGFNCRIMPLRAFPGGSAFTSAEAIIYAADHGAKVINMSYGGSTQSSTERNAVNYAWGNGVVLVSSSGNHGSTTVNFPAGYSNVIAVGSTGQNDLRSNFSNFGSDWVDVGAPGDSIESFVNGGYDMMTGTSMASPMASGVVALLWSFAPPGTTAAQIRAALEENTDPIANGGFANGRVNAFKALISLDPGTVHSSSPFAASLWKGSSLVGSVNDLLSTDGLSLRVGTVPTSTGHEAGAAVDFALSGPTSGLRDSSLFVEGNGAIGSTGQVWLFDYTFGRYVLIRSFALRPSGLKREKIQLPANLTKYLSSGNMRALVRAIGPKRPLHRPTLGAFELKIGFLQISTTANS